MKRRDVFDLVTLGLLWGLGFLLIGAAVPEFGAIVLIEVRMLLAAALLLPLALARRHGAEMLANWPAIALMGLLQYALPFCLFAWAMLTLPAGYSSIVNAASPLFAGVVARLWIGERLATNRAAGLALGLGGVVLLVWEKLFAVNVAGDANGLPVAAAVGAAFCYGLAAVFAKRKLVGVSPTAIAGGSMSAAGLILLPASIWFWPDRTPSVETWAMTAVLGVLCTAFAFVLYFRLIASAGPSRAISVTFLVPVFAVAFGALLADEPITPPMIAGGVTIALGTALATGMLELRSFARRVGRFGTRLTPLVVATACVLDVALSRLHAADFGIPVHLSANTFASRPESDWKTFSTLSASGQLEVVSADRKHTASIFAEYHASDDTRVDGTTFAGVSAGRRLGRWEATGYWLVARFPGSAPRPGVKLRLRHRLRERHKLGVEYMADADAPDKGQLQLGYYGTLRPGLTLKLLLGADLGHTATPVVRLGMSWQAR